jgi:hypothetical protein
MPVSPTQLYQFADEHQFKILFLAAPRYLAGPGDPRLVTHGLAACGWKLTSDPLGSRVRLVSPDGQGRLEYDPTASSQQWCLYGGGTTPSWRADFGEVPTEILSRLTDAVVLPPPPTVPGPLAALHVLDWRVGSGFARSPDNRCLIDRTSYDDGWWIEARRDPLLDCPGPPVWTGMIPDAAPAHLLHAFVCAVADPEPLLRGMYDRTHIRDDHRLQRSTVSGEQIVTAHNERLKSLRAQWLAAKRSARKPSSAAPPPALAPPGLSAHL